MPGVSLIGPEELAVQEVSQGAILRASQVIDAYARWAPTYDIVFAAIMRRGRMEAAAAASRPGGRVLDVGVGTGLELAHFDPATRVAGVDLSEAMLRRARRRVQLRRLGHVEGLMVMDGTRLGFRDASFDAVVAPFVLTVVPDPRALLGELARVVKVGGEIVLVNHFGAEAGALAWVEHRLGRHSARLGWHPHFSFSILADWLASVRDVDLVERRVLRPFGLFTLVRLKKTAAAADMLGSLR